MASATFFCEDLASDSDVIELAESEAHHIRVLRLETGETVGLRNGSGLVGIGELVKVSKRGAEVRVTEVNFVPRQAPIHLIVPVADRERMLWLAEKAAELNIASWNPVVWRRSRSVSPRGEGEGFASKVKARMISAMLQSRSAWIPEISTEQELETVISRFPSQVRLVLQQGGDPMIKVQMSKDCIVVVGPEGGFESDELSQLYDLGFNAVAIGESVLRFETAGLAGIAIAKCLLSGR